MKILPRSLFGRLLGIATLTTLAALAFATFTIGHVLERFVIHGLDQQLDAEIGMLAKAVRPDGTLDRARVVDLPAFAERGSGWGWRADGPNGRWTGGATIGLPRRPPSAAPPMPGRDLSSQVQLITTHPPSPSGEGLGVGDVSPRPALAGRPHPNPSPEGEGLRMSPTHQDLVSGPHPGDGRGPSGERVHYRQMVVRTAAGPVTVTASGPRRVALAPLREAMAPLLFSLGLLGAGLALATFFQLHFGLRPLRTLRASLAEVRAGRLRHIPLDQPDELAPLAIELNALIDQNEAGLDHARRHVANLAHGLKTPLAALGVRLAERGRDPDGSLGEMVARIDRHIRHHLGRARAAAPGGAQRSRTLLAPAVIDLINVLQRLHVERAIGVAMEVAPGLAVAVDPQDLDEMIGNLLDNAWRHARSSVGIVAAATGADLALTIEDDGPGLTDAAMAEALVAGRRLDERGDGHGFGLSITQELAQLNGGAMTLGASTSGTGLLVRLRLPAAGQTFSPAFDYRV